MKHFIDYGHRLGYLVSFYQLDALIQAHADFISTEFSGSNRSLIGMPCTASVCF